MNLHYIKTGAAVIVMAILTYVFFPVSAERTATKKPTSRTAQASTQQTNKVNATRTASGKQKQIKKKSIHKSAALAKQSEQKIEPDKTLRKEQTSSRSGPPSKMYGGI